MTATPFPFDNSYFLGDAFHPPADGPGSRYNCRYGHHEIVLYHPVDRNVVDACNNQPIKIAVWPDDPVMWVLYQVEGFTWADAPFTIHNVEPEGRINNPIRTPHDRYMLTFLLVDSETSVISAIRTATIPPETSLTIHRTITRQLAQPHDPDRYRLHVDRAYREHPHTESMVEHAPLVQHLGS